MAESRDLTDNLEREEDWVFMHDIISDQYKEKEDQRILAMLRNKHSKSNILNYTIAEDEWFNHINKQLITINHINGKVLKKINDNMAVKTKHVVTDSTDSLFEKKQDKNNRKAHNTTPTKIKI